MALTASVRREEGPAEGAGASGRRKDAGAPRNGEESFLVGAWEGRPWRDKEVMAMAVFIAARWRGSGDMQSAAKELCSGVLPSAAHCLLSNPQVGGQGKSPRGYAFSQGKRTVPQRHQACMEHEGSGLAKVTFLLRKSWQDSLNEMNMFFLLMRRLMMHRRCPRKNKKLDRRSRQSESARRLLPLLLS